MYHRFKWTSVSARRNGLTAEFEPLQPFFLLALARRAECRTFVDVGASIGVYSLFATTVESIAQVVTYEANAACAAEIRKNCSLNGIDVRLREVAVSDRPGMVEFGLASRYAGTNSVIETSIHDSNLFHEVTQVEAVTLDADLAEIATPIALKIDVEGHEEAVITGANRLLSDNACVIQIEDFGNRIEKLLGSMGYTLLTRIGPDSYFANLPELANARVVKEVYEAATAALIASNHEDKSVMLQRGDFGLRVSGSTYHVLRRVAQRLIGRRL